MAGDISKIQQQPYGYELNSYVAKESVACQPVTEKAFDEYHLYNITRKVDLLDRETKQIEFVRAINVKASKFYIYDGFNITIRNHKKEKVVVKVIEH